MLTEIGKCSQMLNSAVRNQNSVDIWGVLDQGSDSGGIEIIGPSTVKEDIEAVDVEEVGKGGFVFGAGKGFERDGGLGGHWREM
jgi:hypothetical protein